jgi:hypothetical protein
VATTPALPRLGATERRDAWWLPPLATGLALLVFGVYAAFAAIQGSDYLYEGGGARYLSPFYSPDLESLFGFDVPFSPAFLVLWAPLGLRLTCYYYRKAYYRSFFLAPPACAVAGLNRRYRGESRFPLVLQNVHRYFLYFALVFLIFLSHDAWKAMWFAGPDGKEHFGIGLGTLVLTLNVVLLTGYTFGCHSLRHLVGGVFDVLSNKPVRRKSYECVTWCNKFHMRWAWMSLFGVAFSDVFVRLCAMGVWSDWRIL